MTMLYAPEDGYSVDDSPEIPPETVNGLLNLIEKVNNDDEFRKKFNEFADCLLSNS